MIHPVTLKDGTTRDTVAAELDDDLAVAALAEVEAEWSTFRRAGNDRLVREGRSHLVHHGNWNWNNAWKTEGVGSGRFRLVGVRIGDAWQGVMSLYSRPINCYLYPRWKRWVERIYPGTFKPPQGVYVDYLETAPWNYEPFVEPHPPRFRGIGIALILDAVRSSMSLGLRGRIGLYSLDTSEGFYRRLGFEGLFRDRSPSSPTCGLRYYELHPDAAAKLLSDV